LLLCFFAVLAPTVEASEIYAEGEGFQITAEDSGGVGFQMDKGVFVMEVLSGALNGTDCSLGLLYRGGNLYFHNTELCYVTFYQSSLTESMGLTVEVNGESQRFAVQPSTEYNWTLSAGAEVYLTWSYALTMPHEENFMLYLGILGIALIIVAVGLTVYAFRHYIIFTLSDKETVWEKDVLPVALACFIFGIGLTFAWLLQGV
jgi:hypothetical protein